MFGSKWIKGFILGGVIAAAVALLTASRSGRETRAMIAKKGVELRDTAVSTINKKRGKLGEVAGEVVDKTRTQAQRLKKVGQKAMTAEKDILDRGIQDAQDALKS